MPRNIDLLDSPSYDRANSADAGGDSDGFGGGVRDHCGGGQLAEHNYCSGSSGLDRDARPEEIGSVDRVWMASILCLRCVFYVFLLSETGKKNNRFFQAGHFCLSNSACLMNLDPFDSKNFPVILVPIQASFIQVLSLF